MLSNIVGTVLAFVTIMLVLSLIVTAMVQFTQATLRLRGRNLLVGVAALIQRHSPAVGKSGNSPQVRSDAKQMAAHALNDASASPLVRSKDPNSWSRILLGPPVSWVEPAQLAQAVVNVSAASVSSAAAIPATPPLPSSIAATPKLIRSLPTEEARREAILAAVPSLTKSAGKLLSFGDDRLVETALTTLKRDFPNDSELFEEVSGESESKQDMVNELNAVMAHSPNGDRAVAEYSVIIDSLTLDSAKDSISNATNMLSQLNSFGIEFWSGGSQYYLDLTACRVEWIHVIGVLITCILLSLGAPFWFQQLKNLSSLRDVMNGSPANTTKA